MLIGISGKKGSGKDTIANLIMDSNPNYEVRRFAGKLKQIVSLLTGIDVTELEDERVKESALNAQWQQYDLPGVLTYRKALQVIGTDLFRKQFHPNVWVNALFADYKRTHSWIIPDVRFPNEYKAIKDRGGIIIRVNRPGIEECDHVSETALDDHEFDFVIENSSDIGWLDKRVREDILPFLDL